MKSTAVTTGSTTTKSAFVTAGALTPAWRNAPKRVRSRAIGVVAQNAGGRIVEDPVGGVVRRGTSPECGGGERAGRRQRRERCPDQAHDVVGRIEIDDAIQVRERIGRRVELEGIATAAADELVVPRAADQPVIRRRRRSASHRPPGRSASCWPELPRNRIRQRRCRCRWPRRCPSRRGSPRWLRNVWVTDERTVSMPSARGFVHHVAGRVHDVSVVAGKAEHPVRAGKPVRVCCRPSCQSAGCRGRSRCHRSRRHRRA